WNFRRLQYVNFPTVTGLSRGVLKGLDHFPLNTLSQDLIGFQCRIIKSLCSRPAGRWNGVEMDTDQGIGTAVSDDLPATQQILSLSPPDPFTGQIPVFIPGHDHQSAGFLKVVPQEQTHR